LCFLFHFSLFSTAECTLQDSLEKERGRWVVGKGYKPEENAEEVEASKVETHQKQCPLWGENVKLVKKKPITTNKQTSRVAKK